MAERLNCSNCGGPVTRQGSETSVACPHCQTVTEFPPLAKASDDDDSQRGGRREAPNIVIIQAPAPVQPAPVFVQQPPVVVQRVVQAPAPIVVERVVQASAPAYAHNRPVVIVRRSRGSSLRYIVGPIFFILLFVGISMYIRMRATKAVESAEGAERSAEKGAEKAAEKKPHH